MPIGSPKAAGLTRSGAGEPPRVRSASVSLTANATTSVIGATAAKEIVALSFEVTTAAAAAGLVQLKEGNTVLWQAHLPSAGAVAIVVPPIPGGELFRLTANTALTAANAGTTNPAYINIRYLLEDK